MIRLGHLLWESRLLSTQNYWKTWCYVISMSWLLLLRFVAPCFSGSEYFYLFLLINAYFPSWYYKHYCQLPFTNKTVILILSMVKLNKLQYPTLVSMQSLIFNELHMNFINKVVLPRPYELHMNSKAVSGGEQEK